MNRALLLRGGQSGPIGTRLGAGPVPEEESPPHNKTLRVREIILLTVIALITWGVSWLLASEEQSAPVIWIIAFSGGGCVGWLGEFFYRAARGRHNRLLY